MRGFDIFLYGIIALFFAQGLLLIIAPQRFAAYQLWKYRRLYGARPAEAGRYTLLFYRMTGIGSLAIAVFAFLRFPSGS